MIKVRSYFRKSKLGYSKVRSHLRKKRFEFFANLDISERRKKFLEKRGYKVEKQVIRGKKLGDVYIVLKYKKKSHLTEPKVKSRRTKKKLPKDDKKFFKLLVDVHPRTHSPSFFLSVPHLLYSLNKKGYDLKEATKRLGELSKISKVEFFPDRKGRAVYLKIVGTKFLTTRGDYPFFNSAEVIGKHKSYVRTSRSDKIKFRKAVIEGAKLWVDNCISEETTKYRPARPGRKKRVLRSLYKKYERLYGWKILKDNKK